MEAFQTQGIKLPRLGLGTYRMQGDVCRAAVESALALGYRHIDTAEMYGNEDAIGAPLLPPACHGASCMSPPRSGTKISHPTPCGAPSKPA